MRAGQNLTALAVFLAVVTSGAFVALAAIPALAQTTHAPGPSPARVRPAGPRSGAKRTPAPADAGPPAAGAFAPAPAAGLQTSAGMAATGANDGGVVEARTLDGGTRVFKFSELDIEGRLKSPQLVYFLRRVRAEFAAGDLGHRTFLREMSETRKEPTF
jgi:hypothetical protein